MLRYRAIATTPNTSCLGTKFDSFHWDGMTPETQKASHVNCNFSARVLQLATSGENKDDLIYQGEKAYKYFVFMVRIQR
jgi:hypothetical protein